MEIIRGLKVAIVPFLSLMVMVGCKSPHEICGLYQEKKEFVTFQLELSCDSVFVLTKNTLPANMQLKGTWQVEGDILKLNVMMESQVYRKEESNIMEGELTSLPIRENQWELRLQDFGLFKIKGKSIETNYKGDRILFVKQGF